MSSKRLPLDVDKRAVEVCLKRLKMLFHILGISGGSVVSFSRVGVHSSPSDREPVGANLELGELEQLTITNDNESSSYDVRA